MEYNKLLKCLRQKMTPEIAAAIGVFVIGFIILFMKPIIGVADNGDFYRIISQNDLYHISKADNDIMFGYFTKDYGIYKYATELPTTIRSTQSIFIKLAVSLSQLFSDNYIFDIRFLSIIFLVLHIIAAYLLVKVLTKNLEISRDKYIMAAIYVFVFADLSYIAYFNSFYGEAVIIACFLLSIGILLYMIRFHKINKVNIVLFTITSMLFFGAKQQLAPIGLLVAFILIRIAILYKDKLFKIVTFALSMTCIFIAFFSYMSIEGDFDYMNRFHAITRGVLMNSDDPEKALESLNIEGRYSLLKGQTFYEEVPSISPYDERLMKEFYDKYSIGSILLYYLKNPTHFWKILETTIKYSYSIKPESMGNYQKVEGKPWGEKSYFFSGWSLIKGKTIFNNIIFTSLFIIAYFTASFNRYRRAFKDKDNNKMLFEEAYVYIFLAGVSQIFVSIVGAGDADLAKHVFLYNLTFDAMFVTLISQYLFKWEVRKGEKR